MSVPAVEMSGLRMTVRGRQVLHVEHFELTAGECASIVGPRESGLPLLWELVTGRARPSQGYLRLLGLDPAHPAERERLNPLVGVLSAEDGHFAHLGARTNLRLHCELWGVPWERAEEVLGLVGLTEEGDTRVRELTPSQSRRLAFARTLLRRPRLLLLQEPLARCDAETRRLLRDLVRDQVEAGAGGLLLSEEASDIVGICDRVYRLQHGSLAEEPPAAPPEETAALFEVPVRLGNRTTLLDPSRIYFAKVEEGRTVLRTRDGRLYTPLTLTELEGRLARSGFFRAHRSYLVNLQHVKTLAPGEAGGLRLLLDDEPQTEIPLSRSAERELRKRQGL